MELIRLKRRFAIIIIIITVFLTGIKARAQELVIYPPPQGVIYSQHNDDYTVKVRVPAGEWKDVFEYNVKVDLDKPQDASMAYFDFSGPVEVAVRKNNGNVQTVAVRPNSFGIRTTLKGNTAFFTLPRPMKVSVEFDGDRLHNLHLFGNAVEASRHSNKVTVDGIIVVNPRHYTITNSILWADVAHPINIGLHGNTEKEGELIENITFKNIDILEHDEDDPDYQGCMAINSD